MQEDIIMKKVLLTKAALEKLENELDELIKKRKLISEEIKKAREFGDLSENAEYHAAREAQSLNETEILKVKELLENYELADETSDFDGVRMNSEVVIVYEDGDEDTITIVTKIEADPFEGLISNESPIGSALLGKRKGEQLEVVTPEGVMQLTIKEIIN